MGRTAWAGMWGLMLSVAVLPGAWGGTGKSAPASQGAGTATKSYVIGTGDVLGLEVWKDPTLTRSVVVLTDGKVTVPLIGDVMAGGRTVAEVKKEIETRLSTFIPKPVLTLEVKQCNSLYVFVMGRVNNPGRSSLAGPVNVLQALAMAGGPNPFARRDRIRIFRREGAQTTIIPFDYDAVTEGRHLEQNIELSRGDVVFVP